MSLRPHDEQHDPVTGEWTCPGCLRRRDAADGCSDELGHLCDDCWEQCMYDLRHLDREAREGATGLRWELAARHCRAPSSWWLYCDGRVLGVVLRAAGGSWFAVLRSVRRSERIHTGTLADCARALVDAVRGASEKSST